MKNIKKTLAALLAVCMLLALAACGSENPPASDTDLPGDVSQVSDDATVSDDGGDDVSLTVTAGVLTMGTNAAFPPYEFYNDGKNIVGIDAEIAAAIAEKLGLELVIEDMEFDSIIPTIQAGRIDVGLAGMTVTDERLESVSFSTSYATGVQVIIVKEGSSITSVDDLFADGASHTIGVQRNTTGDLYTTEDLEDKGLAAIDRYSKGADAVMALLSGRVDCVVIDNEPAKAFVEANDGLKILETEYIEEQYSIAVNINNDALLEAIDAALKELIADGTVGSIIDKYITED